MGGDALICSYGFDICPSLSLSLSLSLFLPLCFFFLALVFANCFFSFSLFYYFLFLFTPPFLAAVQAPVPRNYKKNQENKS